jgi:hypothetical protein
MKLAAIVMPLEILPATFKRASGRRRFVVLPWGASNLLRPDLVARTRVLRLSDTRRRADPK